MLVYKAHEYYSLISTINHSEMGLMFTNLANELGHHLVEESKRLLGNQRRPQKMDAKCPVRLGKYGMIWVCLKIGYIPNYSHLIGIMIINHWVYGYTIFRHTHMLLFMGHLYEHPL